MHTFRTAVTTVALAIAIGATAPAASPRDTLLVSTAWLADHLKDPNLVLLHVGDKTQYDKTHIAGARYLTLDDISVSDHEYKGNGLMLEMPPVDDLRARLSKLGISDASHVVVYFGQNQVSPSTRVMLTLDYAGLGDRSALLDGGLPAWTISGHAVTSAVTPEKAGTLAPLKTRPIVVDAKFVFEHLKTPGFAMVDGRAKAFYDGVQTGNSMGHPHKPGHIAGAHNVPFTEVTTDQLTLKSTDELQALFTAAGVKPGDTRRLVDAHGLSRGQPGPEGRATSSSAPPRIARRHLCRARLAACPCPAR